MQEKRVIFSAKEVCGIEAWQPESLQANEVFIRTEASLVSPGTEMSKYLGKHSNFSSKTKENRFAYPMQPGYCLVGRIEKCGSEVNSHKIGQRVFVLAPHASACIVCEDQAVKVDESIDIEQILFIHLASISLNGVRRANIEFGEKVLICGQGLIGLLATYFAKQMGAFPLIATDFSQSRLKLAQKYGAKLTFAPNQEELQDYLQETGLPPVVIEATGIPSALLQSTKMVERGGRVILLGSPHGSVEINFYDAVHSRNVQLIGAHITSSFHASTVNDPWSVDENRKLVMRLMSQGELDVSPMIGGHFTPDQVPSLYRKLKEPGCDSPGMIIDWR